MVNFVRTTPQSFPEPHSCPICEYNFFLDGEVVDYNKEVIAHDRMHPHHSPCLLQHIENQRRAGQTPKCSLCDRNITHFKGVPIETLNRNALAPNHDTEKLTLYCLGLASWIAIAIELYKRIRR